MRRAGMCLGSDLFGKSSPLRGINNLLATQINERQMHSLLTLLPVCAQQQLRGTLEGWAKSAFDVRDGRATRRRQCKCNVWRPSLSPPDSDCVWPFALCAGIAFIGGRLETKAEFPFIGFRTAVKCIRLTITLHNKLRPASRSAAADRLDHRPSGNQDQRDQAGVWSSDQDRQPAGRDERPSCDHHRDAGQHQPGPVPHYLLVSTADRHLLVQCEWKILV